MKFSDFFRPSNDEAEWLRDEAFANEMWPNPTEEEKKFKRPHVVILVHGINTWADWVHAAKPVLEDHDDIRVVHPKYGKFGVIPFLLPTKLFALGPKRRVLNAILTEANRPTTKRLSIVAHSFGSYLIGEILKTNDHVRLHRVILCGSIIKQKFNWLRYQHKIGTDRSPEKHVLNLCAKGDWWPTIANFVTFVYGRGGVKGFFDNSHVEDVFRDGGHSSQLTPKIARDDWVPFLCDGTLPE